ncbi:MAG: tetratricopeptide repeat protein [Erythrobacter sp.]
MLALGGCSGAGEEPGDPDAIEIEGSAEFVETVKDARAAMRDGNLSDAAGFLDRAFELESENPALWIEIARLRFSGGEHFAALEAAEKALELDPEFGRALHLRGQMVRDAHGMAIALPWFEAAHVAAPENTEILADWAATLGDLGRNIEMLAAVRKLAEIDPRHPKVHYLQAVLAARGDKPVLARSLLERSSMIDRNVPAALLLDAVIDLGEGNHDSATLKLEALAQRQPGNVRIRELFALALWLGGRNEELINRMAVFTAEPDVSPYLLTLVARAHERLGQVEAAAPLLERAAAERITSPIVLNTLALDGAELPQPTRQIRELIAQGEARGASRFAQSLGERFPGSADIHSLMGDASLADGENGEALELYQKAAEIRRPWPLTQRIMATSLNSGDGAASDAFLLRHIVGEPANSDAIFVYARRSAAAEDWLRVAVLVDHVIDLGAGNDPELLTLRSMAARELGRDDEAERFANLAGELRVTEFVPHHSE